MISKVLKTLTNSALLLVLLGMLILPIGSMGIISFKENTAVLSAQDTKMPGNTVETPSRPIPKEVEDVILKMEDAYKQSSSAPTVVKP
jgi:hypothetical protein